MFLCLSVCLFVLVSGCPGCLLSEMNGGVEGMGRKEGRQKERMSQLRVSVYDLLGWVTYTFIFSFFSGWVISREGKVREGSNPLAFL